MGQAGNVLIIFIKNPEKGKVKTRLAAELGDERALAIYNSLLAHTRAACLAVPAHRLLFYSKQIDKRDDWPEADFDKQLQAGGELGQRIDLAFQAGFEAGAPVMIIGSDCPQLSSTIITQGFQTLEQHDFVLGPALDGGYYLLGMQAYSPSLFHGIDWSTDKVADQTRERIAALGGSLYELPVLSDVDYAEDWAKYGWPL